MHALSSWLLVLALYAVGRWYVDFLRRRPYEDQGADGKPRPASPETSSHATEKGGQRAAEIAQGHRGGSSSA